MKVTDEVYMIDAMKGSYGYLVTGRETVLIDTGYPGRIERIKAEVESIGIAPEEIKHILLTHNDIDHVGNVAELQAWTGAAVWISREDLPAMMREARRPGWKRFLSLIYRAKLPQVVNTLTEGQEVGGVKALAAPGHTPGHMCFIYNDVLFAGDLIDTRKGAVHPLPKGWNWDNEMNLESLDIINKLDFTWICPAHGEPTKR